MKKRVLIAVALTVLVLMIFAMPALAAIYRSTYVGFSYVGDIFHEKVVTLPRGGSNLFQVTGRGEASGSHSVSSREAVYGGGGSNSFYLSTRLSGTTALDAAQDEHVRLISEIYMGAGQNNYVQTGVEMDPGESGYIRQMATHTTGSHGEYMKVSNHFGNTGGITRRVTEVEGHMSDRMEVIGSAQVWETTRKSSGTARSGFWGSN